MQIVSCNRLDHLPQFFGVSLFSNKSKVNGMLIPPTAIDPPSAYSNSSTGIFSIRCSVGHLSDVQYVYSFL